MLPTDPNLIVGGCPRSGTTLLRNMLDAHPRIAAPPESYFVASTVRRLRRAGVPDDLAMAWAAMRTDRFFREWRLPEDSVVALARLHPPKTVADLMRLCFAAYANRESASVVVDKTPNSFVDHSILKPVFPTSRWLYVARDPRPTVMSWVCQTFTRGGVASGAIAWRRHWEASKEVSRTEADMLTLRYEDLIRDPAAELTTVVAALGIEFDDAMVLTYGARRPLGEHHRASGDPLTQTLRDWRRELSRDDVAVIEWICGDAMEELGYARVAGRRTIRAAGSILRAQFGELDRGWLARRYGWDELLPSEPADPPPWLAAS